MEDKVLNRRERRQRRGGRSPATIGDLSPIDLPDISVSTPVKRPLVVRVQDALCRRGESRENQCVRPCGAADVRSLFMILFCMILFPSDFPGSTGRDSQNHVEQNHGETVNGWASDNQKARRTLWMSPGSRVCASHSSVAVSPTTHTGIQPRNTRNTRKMQGVVVEDVSGSGVSHPFREAVGRLSSVFLFVCFVTFVVPLRRFGCSDPEYRRWGRTHGSRKSAGFYWSGSVDST